MEPVDGVGDMLKASCSLFGVRCCAVKILE
jgi:hypothetical protein